MSNLLTGTRGKFVRYVFLRCFVVWCGKTVFDLNKTNSFNELVLRNPTNHAEKCKI